MAAASSSPSPPATRTSASPNKDDLRPMGLKIAELNESQSELLSKLQGLKQDLQDWKSKLDTQVKTYKEELIELKKVLNTDLDELKSNFQELKTTLQQQQDDISVSLRNLGLEDISESSKESESEDTANVSGKTGPSFS
ncbi:CAP-Gly domain-containing linker protein 1 [Phalaenopsis equestris]|uniref:CAP-Gly domain-containing linker protein 1 n=1 Tax=Phalaenopsis equestris TaxID=78828 RepID=UPI0009E23A98|nr:CAP-Gly domain-containing linker protein 1 [Phalaenopsis equestris]